MPTVKASSRRFSKLKIASCHGTVPREGNIEKLTIT
jgi:hypothetical protein